MNSKEFLNPISSPHHSSLKKLEKILIGDSLTILEGDIRYVLWHSATSLGHVTVANLPTIQPFFLEPLLIFKISSIFFVYY
jgi:hypothetical protein